jgi:hypothetical protein
MFLIPLAVGAIRAASNICVNFSGSMGFEQKLLD